MRYFDLHCDTARVCFYKGLSLDDATLSVRTGQSHLFKDWYQCYAVFIPDNSRDPQREYENILRDTKSKLCGVDQPKPIYTLENGIAIDDLRFVDRLEADGIKAVTLTWNGENALAGGAYSDAGLKPFGKQVIAKLNEKNIACDLSHLNRRSFFEVGEQAKILFASHSCCDGVYPHPRNLTDEQIRYIADRGGVVGICFYSEFLGARYATGGVWRHINHLLDLGLQNHICIGSDFDGADMSGELDGVDKVPALYRYLQSKGIPDGILFKIFFANAYNFFKNF